MFRRDFLSEGGTKPMRIICLIFIALLAYPLSLFAQSKSQSKGQGAIIILDNVLVYKESDSSDAAYKLNRGDTVAARPDAGEMLFRPRYQFEPRNGRIRINFFPRERNIAAT